MKTRTRTTLWTKSLAMILMLLMIFYTLPLYVFAGEAEESEDATASDMQETEAIAQEDGGISLVRGVAEVIERREESVKHFLLEDGSYRLIAYDSPVHYRDENGAWQDIDNTLSLGGSEWSSADARIKFAKKITGNETLFTLHDGSRKLAVSLEGALKKTEGVVYNGSDEDATETQLQKMMTLAHLSSRIVYADILPSVDLEYVLSGRSIKENLIVKQKSDRYAYTFTLALNGMQASLMEDGSVTLSDGDEVLYVMPAPYVYDAEGEAAPQERAYFTLENGGNGKYTLTVTVDSAWMNDEARAYPVTVDPAFYVPSLSVDDTYINSAYPTSTYSTGTLLRVGYTSDADVLNSFWRLTQLPTIPSNAYIVSAQLDLYCKSYNDYTRKAECPSFIVGVYATGTSWSGTTLCYQNTTNKLYGDLQDYASVSGTSINQYVSFNLTSIVNEWYHGVEPNDGVMIISREALMAEVTFASDNATSNKPRFMIDYRDMKGVEDYWSYQSQNVGYAGQGAVNLATGNLVFSIGTLTSTDALLPITPTFVYNSMLSGLSYKYPNVQNSYSGSYEPLGFKLNLHETLIKKMRHLQDGTQEEYYIWADSDATEHSFLPAKNENGAPIANEYRDEDGLGLTLNTSTMTITDRSHTVRTFSPIGGNLTDVYGRWYLSAITDQSGNKLSIGFDSGVRPTTVSLYPNGITTGIEQLRIVYNSTSMPCAIWNPQTGHAVVLKYSETPTGTIGSGICNYLREVIYAHASSPSSVTEDTWISYWSSGSHANVTVDAKASYTYDASGHLIKAKDEKTGYEVVYTYDDAHRVTQITENGYENGSTAATVGQTVKITYGVGYTEMQTSGSDDAIDTSDDLITHTSFDFSGRPISSFVTDKTRTTIYGASSGEYTDNEMAANSLKNVAQTSSLSVNHLYNGSFEEGTTGWSLDGSVSRVQAQPHLGSSSLKFPISSGSSAHATQYVRLDDGAYTLTFYIKGVAAKNTDIVVRVSNYWNIPHVHESSVYHLTYETTEEYTKYSLQFNAYSFYANGETKEKLKICISVTGESGASGSVYIDDVSITQGNGADAFSLLHYGSFTDTRINENGEIIEDAYDFWMDGIRSAEIVKEDDTSQNKVLQGLSTLTTSKYYGQDISFIPVNGTEAYYQISAMGKNPDPCNHEDARFGIRVLVTMQSGQIDTHEFLFARYCTEWQHVVGTFKTEGTVASIRVECFQTGHVAYAYFDNVSLCLATDDAYVEYTYTEDTGKLSSEKSIEDEIFYYYNDEDDLSGVLDGYTFKDFFYDEKHRLLVETLYISSEPLKKDDIPVLPSGDPYPGYILSPSSTTEYTYNAYGLMTVARQMPFDSLGAIEYETVSKKAYHTLSTSHIFGALTSETDSLGNTTQYIYDPSTGLLLATVAPDEEAGYVYTYDASGMLTEVHPINYTSNTSYSKDTASAYASYTYDSQGHIGTITTPTTAYTFAYNAFGDVTSVSVGGNSLVTNTYYAKNGKLRRITYADGSYVGYGYNEKELICTIIYKLADATSKQVIYKYDANGRLISTSDLLSRTWYQYEYDSKGRLLYAHSFREDGNALTEVYTYDAQSRMTGNAVRLQVNGTDIDIQHSYTYTDHENRYGHTLRFGVTGTSTQYAKIVKSSQYDKLGRLQNETSSATVSGTNQTAQITKSYTYSERSNVTESLTGTLCSGQVASVSWQIDGSTHDRSINTLYTYDENGNITSIRKLEDGYDQSILYTYDKLGQVIREDNPIKNETYVYTYDRGGNITSKKTYVYTTGSVSASVLKRSHTYTYGDSDFGDLLTAYNGTSLVYDVNYNPTTYYNGASYAMTWQYGRRLTQVTKDGVTTSYTYNADGIRLSKTVGGVEHKYVLSGSQIVAEYYGTTTNIYLYDNSGSPIGLATRESSDAAGVYQYYYFEKNLQGDVLGIYTASGTKVVWYMYDAYGNITTAFVSGYSTLRDSNPFRYRGYYYDTETGFYYLNSRYYDPVTGRFINADDISCLGANGDLTGYNLFAYCSNNPVMGYDPYGQFDLIGIFKGISEALTDWAVRETEKAINRFIRNLEEDIADFDKNNTDPEACVKSNYFSMYNGTPVISFNLFGLNSFSIGGIIFLEGTASANTVLHEYGHIQQEEKMGFGNYFVQVAIPSVSYNILSQKYSKLRKHYYSMPWEYDADIRGGACRSTGYAPWAEKANVWYWGVWEN